MRRLAWVMMTVAWPAMGFAQDAVIRVEAKRGDAAAAEVAAGWAERFDDVVTFPLARGWTAIALGPMTPEEAGRRIEELKAARQIPADSFVTVPDPGTVLTPADGAGVAEPAPQPVVEAPAEVEPEPVEPEPVASPDMPAPGAYLRLQSLRSAADADEALARWRDTFPEAGLHAMPGGRFAITLGPLEPDTAGAWLAAFKAAGVTPRDAFASDAAELGEVLQPGTAPDLPAAGPAEELPPLDEVQRALRWAGRYDGAIDGTTGPKTREAIAAEVAAGRLSPDPGTAMRLLIEKRAAWRAEMGLSELRDEATGLSVIAPMDRLQFDRAERSLSIYGPKDGSGAALILFSQPGGQQEMLDHMGLVTALGWVPQPDRRVAQGSAVLTGGNDVHFGHAEAWVRDGRAEGFVLIWPATVPDAAADHHRLAAEMADSLTRIDAEARAN